MPHYELDLLQNAADSLEESLRRYESYVSGDDAAIKHAILYLGHFIELYLKHCVSRQHELLIFKNPASDKVRTEDAETITVETAISILKNCNLTLPKPLLDDITKIRKKRNAIMHYKVSVNPEVFLELVGKLVADLSVWDSASIKAGINTLVAPDKWQIIAQNVINLEVKLQAATECAFKFNEQSGVDLNTTCSDCGYETAYIHPDDESEIKCGYCDASHFAQECSSCGLLCSEEVMHHFADSDEGVEVDVWTCHKCAEEQAYGDYLCDLMMDERARS